mmetsp:Transcript_21973/g.58172  ORF Transcript_21973/g.58172 Transcript_21973/m.58172 type:complete len:930 (-) Transcript_21973:716-3505(-)
MVRDSAAERMQRGVFAWADNSQVDRKTLSADEVVLTLGVPAEIFSEYIEKQHTNVQTCLGIPMNLLLVIVYTVVVLTFDDCEALMSVENSIDIDIYDNAEYAAVSDEMSWKILPDIRDEKEFWSWMRLGMVGLFWEDAESPSPSPPLYMGYNRVVGGLRLSQERADDDNYECPSSEYLWSVYDMGCVGGLRYELDPERWEAQSTNDNNRKRTQWLYSFEQKDIIENLVKTLELERWLDNRTMKAEVALPIYNAEYGIYTMMYINFFFSRGGHIWKMIIPLSVYAAWFDSWLKISSVSLWFLCLLYVITTQLAGIHNLYVKKGCVGLMHSYIKVYNVMDWFGILGGIVVIVLFVVLYSFVSELNEVSEVLGTLDPVLDADAYVVTLDDFMVQLESAVNYMHKFRIVMAMYPLIILYRLFKSFRVQPRLGIVTDTLSSAVVDIFHFGFIFVGVIGIFAISAIVLFGRMIDDFTVFQRVFNTAVLTMFGTFDWKSLRVVGRIEAGVWFWMFMILVSLILLNMFMAIVLDAYENVRAETTNAPTLWKDMHNYWLMLLSWYRGERVNNSTIRKHLKCQVDERTKRKKLHAESPGWSSGWSSGCSSDIGREEHLWEELGILTPLKLLEFVPCLKKAQARTLLRGCVIDYYHNACPGVSMERLRIWVDNLLVNLKDWKHAARAQAHSSGARNFPDIAGALRKEVSEIWSGIDQSFLEVGADEGFNSGLPGREEFDRMDVSRDTKSSDDLAEEVAGLESELADVRQRVKKALNIVSNLQLSMTQQQENRAELDRTGKALRERGVALREENLKLREKLKQLSQLRKQRDERPELTSLAKKQNTLQTLVREHEQLRLELSRARSDASVRTHRLRSDGLGGTSPGRRPGSRGTSPRMGNLVHSGTGSLSSVSLERIRWLARDLEDLPPEDRHLAGTFATC